MPEEKSTELIPVDKKFKYIYFLINTWSAPIYFSIFCLPGKDNDITLALQMSADQKRAQDEAEELEVKTLDGNNFATFLSPISKSRVIILDLAEAIFDVQFAADLDRDVRIITIFKKEPERKIMTN